MKETENRNSKNYAEIVAEIEKELAEKARERRAAGYGMDLEDKREIVDYEWQ